jgi:uncharacterized protein YbjT (DUF2867 family)
VLSLRCGHFMENVLNQIGVIQSLGFMGGAVRGDVPLPMIATRDIGAVAAELLARLDFSGQQTRELQGPRHVSNDEAAKIIGAGIGKPGMSYKQLPAMLLRPAMMKMGLSASMVDQILEMSEALNTGHMKSQEARSARNTTATMLQTFVVEEFASAYRGKAAGA